MNKVLGQFIREFIYLPTRYILLPCVILQIVSMFDEYVDFNDGMFYPLGLAVEQFGRLNDCIFILWLILISLTPWKWRIILLGVDSGFMVMMENFTLFRVDSFPVGELVDNFSFIFYNWYLNGILIEEILSFIFFVGIFTVLLCWLSLFVQIGLYLAIQAVLAVKRKLRL